MKKTKIVATIGPASEKIKTLQNMMANGMNVCRLNFSHGEYAWHKSAIRKIRKAAALEKKNIAIIADIQGPRVRIANKTKVDLKKNDRVFVTDEKGTHYHGLKKELVLDWHNFYQYVKRGDQIFIEDGLIQLEIVEKRKEGCVAKVTEEGVVFPHKGVNMPAISAHMGFLTEKDLRDLDFILSQDVDFLAVSFVGSGKDLMVLKRLMLQWKKKKMSQDKLARKEKKIFLPPIISKIERKDAMKNLDEIIENSDAIMVARGDLAIEMPQEKVTILQKDIIGKCLKAKKPVIVATQMMHTMSEFSRPTRAEISDVTNAVIDHTDAVMLSGETAQGKYPEKVIETMAAIIKETEESPYNDLVLKKINKFARLLFRAKKTKKEIKVSSLKELLGLAVLREEHVHFKLTAKTIAEKRRSALVWGAE